MSLHYARRAVALEPERAQLRLDLAHAHAALLQWDDAAEQASRCINLDSQLQDAHELLARAYRASARETLAERCLQDAFARFPNERRFSSMLAQLYADAGRFGDALLALQEAIERDAALDSVQDAREVAGLCLRAATLAFPLGMFEPAQSWLTRATAKAVGDADLERECHELQTEWGAPTYRAREELLAQPEVLIGQTQADIGGWLGCGASNSIDHTTLEGLHGALRSRDYARAKKLLVLAPPAFRGSPAALRLRVDVSLAEGDFEGAQRALARATPEERAAWDAVLFIREAGLLEREGALQAARSVLQYACEIHPISAELAEALGDVAMRCGDPDGARQAWRLAAAIEPSSTAAIKWFAAKPNPAVTPISEKDASFAVIDALSWAGRFGLVTRVEAAALDDLASRATNEKPASTVAASISRVVLTGNVGPVGQEAAKVVHACLTAKSNSLQIAGIIERKILHFHFTDAHMKKDGPSAGLALALAGLAVLLRKPLTANLAATGALSLGGAVEAVGGIHEKLVAACLNGARTVLLPRQNLFDAKKLPARVRRSVAVVPVGSLEEAMSYAFEESPP